MDVGFGSMICSGITMVKVQEVVELMKAWIAPGLDGSVAECLKRGAVPE